MDSLATELLREIKQESKRRFVIILLLIIALVSSNLAWLIAWNLPSEKEISSESYELQGEDNANVVYSSGEGDVRINEQDKGYEEDSQDSEN